MELLMVTIVGCRDGKVDHDHFCREQACPAVGVVLDPAGLRVAGAENAAAVRPRAPGRPEASPTEAVGAPAAPGAF